MQRKKLFSAAVLMMALALMLVVSGCFGNISSDNTPASPTTPATIKPKPRVESVTATTSGNQNAYYVTLDIKVKNEGAKGIVLVVAGVTQNGKTSQNEAQVFLKQGASYELELTFPLVWRGGDFTTNVQAVVP